MLKNLTFCNHFCKELGKVVISALEKIHILSFDNISRCLFHHFINYSFLTNLLIWTISSSLKSTFDKMSQKPFYMLCDHKIRYGSKKLYHLRATWSKKYRDLTNFSPSQRNILLVSCFQWPCKNAFSEDDIKIDIGCTKN